eukprot:8540002-Alexandrium_andersonii.AAC.1
MVGCRSAGTVCERRRVWSPSHGRRGCQSSTTGLHDWPPGPRRKSNAPARSALYQGLRSAIAVTR